MSNTCWVIVHQPTNQTQNKDSTAHEKKKKKQPSVTEHQACPLLYRVSLQPKNEKEDIMYSSFVKLTPSLPWYHLKWPMKMLNLRPLSISFFLFVCTGMWKDVIKTYSIESRSYRTVKYTVYRHVCASFSPDILQVGTVKGLSVGHSNSCPHLPANAPTAQTFSVCLHAHHWCSSPHFGEKNMEDCPLVGWDWWRWRCVLLSFCCCSRASTLSYQPGNTCNDTGK